MKIGVCIKSVPDTTAKIQVQGDGSGIVQEGVKYVISPYDEFAIEQALLVKEQRGNTDEVIVFSLGGFKTEDALRSALAMGADRAIYIQDPDKLTQDPLAVGKVLAKAMTKESVEIVFTGRQAIDDDQGQVAQILAEKLGWPCATVVSAFEIKDDKIEIIKEVDGGAKEKWQLPMQSVIACSKGLNQPRYASLKGIMAAKKKPLDSVSLNDLGIEGVSSQLEVSGFEVPMQVRKNQIFTGATQENVDALVGLLREEAKVI